MGEHYQSSGRVRSGNPNETLVDYAAGLNPGTALGIGCGEGACAHHRSDVVLVAKRAA